MTSDERSIGRVPNMTCSLAVAACAALVSAACGGSANGPHSTTTKGGGGSAGTSTSSSGGGAGGTGSGASSSSGSTSGSSSGGSSMPNGNPDGSCGAGIPAEGQPVDTSKATTVVGTGTAASCTWSALDAAVKKGGIITFDCGSAAVTIPVTATLVPPTSNAYAKDPPLQIVIDGGGKITLDGGGSVEIFSWIHSGSWLKNTDTLTLQHLRLVNGKATPATEIAACPPANGISNMDCSTGYSDGQGGAINVRDGSLRVIDCYFGNNQAAMIGPDTGGGAIYLYGSGVPSYIVQSTFEKNTASNAGAIGMLWAGSFIIDSLFDGNTAVGTGANSNDATKCTCGNHQIGSGGNGGAIYKDGGDGFALTICGTEIRNSNANEFGSAVFLTADGSNAKLILEDSLLKNNTSPISYWNWCLGVSTDNPHKTGSTTCSPSPTNTKFCNGMTCSTTCST